MAYSAPRGTKDILPDETPLWQRAESICRETFALYNYREIRTPVFESTELFTRSIGATTDIVNKEMYTFLDRKGRSLTLRPEATASVVRAGLENNLISKDGMTKLYYLGPMFRYERPQAGRQRQFHQAGVEAFGSDDPRLDAEIIQMSMVLFNKMGIKNLEADINSVGCPACQPGFREAIKTFFKQHIKEMCQDCQKRMEQNPLRILDCKEGPCQKYIEKAPAAADHLCADCRGHFKKVQMALECLAVKYRINDRLVRGLDYYTRTAFEVVSKQLGAQNALCGGGRYDNLVEELGGKPTPAIGFAAGMERLIQVMTNDPSSEAELLRRTGKLQMTNEGNIYLFIAALGEGAKKKGFELLAEARGQGISADMDYNDRGLKAQMKLADRMGAKYVYIIGDNELAKQSAVLKNMQTAGQKEVSFGQLSAALSGETD